MFNSKKPFKFKNKNYKIMLKLDYFNLRLL